LYHQQKLRQIWYNYLIKFFGDDAMLVKEKQLNLNFSKHLDLYDILIPKNHMLRQLNEMIDFSFIYDEIEKNYSVTMGRKAEDCVRMFKFLLLKTMFTLSDRDLVERTKTDMLFKYFLGYEPEELDLIDPSLLTVFRRQRLKDANMLDLLINKTVELALKEGLIKVKNKLIQDSTHTNSMFSHISPREALIKHAKELRKAVYNVDETLKAKMPPKREETGMLEDQIKYTKELLNIIENDVRLQARPAIAEKTNYLKEMLEDTEVELEYSKDKDARVGHKTADSSFFGYKTHIAMTPERIITAATITSGEKHDGKEMQKLVEKSGKAGIEVEAVIGDKAYSGKDNIDYCEENGIKLASKLSKEVTHGKNEGKGFEYNKDAGMYVCKAGHMATRKQKSGSKARGEQVESYLFDIEKCKHCPHKEGCYKEGAKTKTYNVKIKEDTHIKHMEYMETEEFKELYSERYKIEAKNAELKSNYGYDRASACGELGITIQGATTLFLTNIKRIMKLREEKEGRK